MKKEPDLNILAKAEEEWQGLWKGILERPDGSIDVEQLKLELLDFSDLMERMITLTHEVTRGRLSYANYPVTTILQIMDEELQEAWQQKLVDSKEDGVCHLCDQEIPTDIKKQDCKD